jgi:5'-deoxynucleotidase YfbR-like HD superfamily hydrolase
MLQSDEASWSNPKVLVTLLVVFLCGAAFGSVLTRSYIHKRIEHSVPITLQSLRAELKLTPDQEKVITKELDDYVKYYQNIREEQEDVAAVGKQHIFSVLTPEQKRRFNEIFDQMPR